MLVPKDDCQLYLASLSPRRAQLLNQLLLRYQILKPEINETFLADETPSDCAIRLAKEKSCSGLEIAMSQSWPMRPVIAADTLVVVDGVILGKPENREDAKRMLTSLSGRTHLVVTGVALGYKDITATVTSESLVSFRQLRKTEIEAYCQSGEPDDKAGAYAIQGIGACFVTKLEGSYSGVMGLPLFETSELLAKVGISII